MRNLIVIVVWEFCIIQITPFVTFRDFPNLLLGDSTRFKLLGYDKALLYP